MGQTTKITVVIKPSKRKKTSQLIHKFWSPLTFRSPRRNFTPTPSSTSKSDTSGAPCSSIAAVQPATWAAPSSQPRLKGCSEWEAEAAKRMQSPSSSDSEPWILTRVTIWDGWGMIHHRKTSWLANMMMNIYYKSFVHCIFNFQTHPGVWNRSGDTRWYGSRFSWTMAGSWHLGHGNVCNVEHLSWQNLAIARFDFRDVIDFLICSLGYPPVSSMITSWKLPQQKFNDFPSYNYKCPRSVPEFPSHGNDDTEDISVQITIIH